MRLQDGDTGKYYTFTCNCWITKYDDIYVDGVPKGTVLNCLVPYSDKLCNEKMDLSEARGTPKTQKKHTGIHPSGHAMLKQRRIIAMMLNRR